MTAAASSSVVEAIGRFIDIEFVRQTYPELSGMEPNGIRSIFVASTDPDRGEPTGWSLRPNSVFDPALYLLLNKDVRGHNPTLHFLTAGYKEARPWHPLFDSRYVRETLGWINKTDLEVISDYIALSRNQAINPHPLINLEYITAQLPLMPASQVLANIFGGQIDCTINPHPLFDSSYYNQLVDAPKSSLIELLLDFVLNQHDRPPPMFLFDAKTVGDALALRDSPGRTYLTYLADLEKHRFSTSPEFDLRYYKGACSGRALPEVGNPLLHFVKYGLAAEVPPNRILDIEHCRAMARGGNDPIRGYFTGGYKTYAPAPGVDLAFLDVTAPEFEAGKTEFLRWFYSLAPKERPSTHPRFDARFYSAHYKDMQSEKANAATHFLEYGMREDRLPQRWFSLAYIRNDVRYSRSRSSATEEYFRRARNSRPKIIFVSHDATLTGAPAIILRLLKDFSRSSVFECYTLLDMGGPRYRDFEKYSHVYVLKDSAKKIGWESDATNTEVGDMLSSLGGDTPIVAFVNSAESRHIGRALNRFGIPVVSLVHEVASYYRPDSFAEIQEVSNRVVYPSEFVRQAASRYVVEDQSKVRVVGQGLLDDHFGLLSRELTRTKVCRSLSLPEDSKIVLSCGTRNLRKGLDLFTAVARTFFQRNPQDDETYFVWVGGGPEHADTPYFYSLLEAQIYGFEDRLRFVSETSNVEPYFVAADLFLLTSRADPFPCVVHEALAAGAPVVGFQEAGGAEELYRHHGRSVPFCDTSAMAQAVETYLQPTVPSGEDRATRREYIRAEWRSRSYFEYFVREIDSLHGTTFASKICGGAQLSPSERRVHFLCAYPGGANDELVLTTQRMARELGFNCQVHNVRIISTAVSGAVRGEEGGGSEAETWWDWIGSVGSSYRDIIQEIEDEGGGVVVVPPSMLSHVVATGFSDRTAVVCCDSVLDSLEGAAHGAGRVAGIVTLGTDWEEVTRPAKGWNWASFLLNGSETGSEEVPSRIVFAALGTSEEALNTFRRVSELVTTLLALRQDTQIIAVCSEETYQSVSRLASKLYPSLQFDVLRGDRNTFRTLLRIGDLLIASDYGARVPVGLFTALALGCATMIVTNRPSLYQCRLAKRQRLLATDAVRVKEVIRWLRTLPSESQESVPNETALGELLAALLAR